MNHRNLLFLLFAFSIIFDNAIYCQWQDVGATGFSSVPTSYNSIAMDKNGTPYVAFQDDSSYPYKVTVMKFDGSNWANVGPRRFSTSEADYISLAIDSATGNVYVAYEDFGRPEGGLTVRKFNGTNWDTVGISDFTAGDVNYVSIAVYNDTPYVAFEDFSDITDTSDPSVTVVKYNGAAWNIVGYPYISPDEAEYISTAIDHSGKFYVAYQDRNTYTDGASVMTFTDTGWVYVGPEGFTPSGAAYASLAIDNHNTPYIVFSDDTAATINSATVMKFDNGTWVLVGEEGFTNGEADFTSIAFNKADVPYIAYSDATNSGKASVMSFNGATWAPTGSKDFSASQADFTSIALDTNGVIYVGYVDHSVSFAASVMKYNPITGIGELNSITSLCAFPNPGNGQFSVKVQTTQPDELQLAVYNLLGQLVWCNNPVVADGQYSTDINLATVPSGMYLLQVKTPAITQTSKLEIEH